ncbi:MAG: glycosyltransferase [Planctomycetes bacterium]|nr:glycosyltransferase [Planctomycetota bacterium]
MIFYFIFTAVIIAIQLLVLVESFRHAVYTRRKYQPKTSHYHPAVAVICPCKGLDTTFDRNINSLFDQNYPKYEIFFVVQSTDDPAHQRLIQIIEQRQNQKHPVTTHILIAGDAKTCAQKVHNLIIACEALPDHFEVLAFIDSDACLKPHFLESLVHPLRRSEFGASTGYRWFVPTDTRLSSYTLSALNASVASMLGPHGWNSAWGGAMAIKKDTFDNINLIDAWQNACSDDYLLTDRVRKAKLDICFVPACFVASYEQTSWGDLFSFARRQFIITKVCRPRLLWLALLGWGHFALAFWLGLIVTIILFSQQSWQAPYAAYLPAALMVAAITRAVARQSMIRKILPEDQKKLLIPAFIDIFLAPVLSIIALIYVFAAIGSRTITWRGIKYHLRSIDNTYIYPLSKQK